MTLANSRSYLAYCEATMFKDFSALIRLKIRLIVEYLLIATIIILCTVSFTLWAKNKTIEVRLQGIEKVNDYQQTVIETLKSQKDKNNKDVLIK